MQFRTLGINRIASGRKMRSSMRRSLFAELQRRNVIRAAVLYIGVVWALSQGAAQLLPVFDVPTWAVRWFIVAAIIGFPFWIAFAWFFEFTPEGLKRESEVEPHESITHHTGGDRAGAERGMEDDRPVLRARSQVRLRRRAGRVDRKVREGRAQQQSLTFLHSAEMPTKRLNGSTRRSRAATPASPRSWLRTCSTRSTPTGAGWRSCASSKAPEQLAKIEFKVTLPQAEGVASGGSNT